MKKLYLWIIIIVIVGIAGFITYNRTKQESTTKSSNQKIGVSKKVSNPSENGKYLVIREWGVKLDISGSLENLNLGYQIISPSNKSAYFTLKNSDLEPCMNLSLVRKLTSDLAKDFVPRNGSNSPYDIVKPIEIGEYTFYEQRGFSNCDTLESERTQRAEKTMDDISSSINRLKVQN